MEAEGLKATTLLHYLNLPLAKQKTIKVRRRKPQKEEAAAHPEENPQRGRKMRGKLTEKKGRNQETDEAGVESRRGRKRAQAKRDIKPSSI